VNPIQESEAVINTLSLSCRDPRRLAVRALRLGLFMALAMPVGLSAQRTRGATIASDRPGLGNGAYVMAPGEWQAELGGTIEARPNDEFLVGSALVRIGFEALELRVFVPSIYGLYSDDFLEIGDLGIGAKIPVELAVEGWRWAATAALTVASGTDAVSAGDTGGRAGFVGETSLSETVGLALNAGYGFGFDHFGDGTLSLLATPTFALTAFEGLSLYVGYAAYLRPGDDAHVIEWGLAKMKGADRQWDLNAGYDRGGNTWFLGVGVAQRNR
jgi:hypothetical protein